MPDYLIDLLFWIVLFVVLFIGLRRLQKRKRGEDE